MSKNRYLDKDEYSERGRSQDKGGSEKREWERARDGRRDKRDERYRDEKGSANDRRGRGKEFSDRHQDMRPHSHKDRPPDHRPSNKEGQQRTYTEPSVSPSEVEYYEPPHRQSLYNLRYTLTTRGLCQIMEVFVNLLIVICSGVNYSNTGVYRDLASLGGIYQYYFGGAQAFTGAEADRVKELDQLFNQLKLPPYIFSMACGGALMAYACVMLALGVLRIPYRWPPMLLAETLMNLVVGLGYIPALAFYFIKLQETYDSPVCKEREALYKSKGHQGFECSMNGADIAGGLFGALGVIVFMFGTVLAIRAFRAVRETKRQRAMEDDNL
ncbi:MARVEL domain-containing protein 3 [Esox lucius]|uniref:MARVEL domain-containing protein n=1 Tax=Esox lucius TaxID=8010 RepID=A0A3P9A3N1_ESOLU|nr:MARVEL domain-containing protein 3 [Esox lucius]XP_010878947.2 MARVEL domain-containing protein 3 [Esox lucius]XP_010878966.2 MARVEL domain-containing protein 3 [Esox lucius]